MPVITIRGLTGSGAPDIGHAVARLIEGDYVDRQVIAEVASLLKLPHEQVEEKEKLQPDVFRRIMEPLRRILSGSGKIESAYTRTWEEPLNDEEYLDALETVIRDLALEKNIVLVGRGSQFILRNNQSVLHVLVVAPLEDRLNKAMIDLSISREDALRYIEETDTSRRAFVQRFFQKELEDPQHYDLVINTRYISYDAASRLIIDAAKEKNPWHHQ
jgi:cytidylate kinase